MTPISSNFIDLARAQPDLVDFMNYLGPTLERMSFMVDKISKFDTTTAQKPHNRETRRQIEALLYKELPELVKNYCALELRWRNCEIITEHNNQSYTSKDVLLQNLEKICALTQQLFQEFQQHNKKDLLTQNRYLMQKSLGLEVEKQFTNQFDYSQYQAQAKEISIEPLIALMAQNKQKEKELIDSAAIDFPYPIKAKKTSIKLSKSTLELMGWAGVFASFLGIFSIVFFNPNSLESAEETKYREVRESLWAQRNARYALYQLDQEAQKGNIDKELFGPTKAKLQLEYEQLLIDKNDKEAQLIALQKALEIEKQTVAYYDKKINSETPEQKMARELQEAKAQALKVEENILAAQKTASQYADKMGLVSR